MCRSPPVSVGDLPVSVEDLPNSVEDFPDLEEPRGLKWKLFTVGIYILLDCDL